MAWKLCSDLCHTCNAHWQYFSLSVQPGDDVGEKINVEISCVVPFRSFYPWPKMSAFFCNMFCVCLPPVLESKAVCREMIGQSVRTHQYGFALCRCLHVQTHLLNSTYACPPHLPNPLGFRNLPTGVLFDLLLGPNPSLPWVLTVHYHHPPAGVVQSWQNQMPIKGHMFNSLKVRFLLPWMTQAFAEPAVICSQRCLICKV